MQLDFSTIISRKTDRELADIYVNYKEYQPDFVKAAAEELAKRNISLENFQLVKEQRLMEENKRLSIGKDGSPLFIFICFVLALLGGIIALIAGYTYSESKHTNSLGEKFYVYNESTRKLGRMMMCLGGAVIISMMLYKLFKNE